MHFAKWHGCGNDFVFVNAMDQDMGPVVAHCTEICDRHFGIGADGIIFVLPSEKADIRMRILMQTAVKRKCAATASAVSPDGAGNSGLYPLIRFLWKQEPVFVSGDPS